ncbi:hypothetical protein SRHO_G00188980 [Serrasalmus rhombeus]
MIDGRAEQLIGCSRSLTSWISVRRRLKALKNKTAVLKCFMLLCVQEMIGFLYIKRVSASLNCDFAQMLHISPFVLDLLWKTLLSTGSLMLPYRSAGGGLAGIRVVLKTTPATHFHCAPSLQSRRGR